MLSHDALGWLDPKLPAALAACDRFGTVLADCGRTCHAKAQALLGLWGPHAGALAGAARPTS